MISQNNFVRCTNKYVFDGTLRKEYDNYRSYISSLDLSPSTIDWRLKHIRGLLHFMQQKNLTFETLTPKDVYQYMKTLETYSARTKEHRATCIRMFLNWLHHEKKTKLNGRILFPEIKCNKEEHAISFYSNDEISDMINAVDKDSLNGKRDLAILLLFARLGLRQKDVQTLKLESLKWQENKITIIQSKTREINTYTMLEEIRYALIDYLKSERPKTDSPYVFIKENKDIYNEHFFYNLVNKYFKKAGINTSGKRHGTHIFRHSIATSLLNDGASIKEISDILGHLNPNDSRTYIKVDFKNLKKIPLEVPSWNN